MLVPWAVSSLARPQQRASGARRAGFSRCCVDERAQLYACDLLELNAEDLEQLIGNDGPGLMLSRAIEETPERMTTAFY